MKKGQLTNGFKYEVDEDVLKDMEVVDDLVALESDDGKDESARALVRVSTKILGREQKKALYDHIRNDKGRVDPKDFGATFRELLEAIGDEGKN